MLKVCLLLPIILIWTPEPPELVSGPRFSPGTITLAESDQDYPYQLLHPVSPTQNVPLVVYLHGAGERGRDNQAQLSYLPRQFTTASHLKDRDCYVLAMQCPRGETWAPFRPKGPLPERPLPAMTALMTAIQEVVQTYSVDTSRIYLTGLSMGGFGTWELAARKPEWFAAAVPICGGGRPSSASRLTELPIWAFHGQIDQIVPETASRRMIDAIRAAGGRPAYSSLPGVGHNSWLRAYGRRGAMDWLFAQENPQPGLIKRVSDASTPE